MKPRHKASSEAELMETRCFQVGRGFPVSHKASSEAELMETWQGLERFLQPQIVTKLLRKLN